MGLSNARKRASTGFADESRACFKYKDAKATGDLRVPLALMSLHNERRHQDEESGCMGRILRLRGKRQRDLPEGLTCVCFSEHLINYGW